MAIRTLDDLVAQGKRLAVRVDINSPLDGNKDLADDARLVAHLNTLSELADNGGRIAVLAHQGRPGGDAFSCLEPHARHLDSMLEAPVDYVDSTFSSDACRRINALDDGEIIVLENTRFYSEEYLEFPPERAADTYLVTRLSPVLDGYVNDAFAASHRSQPSLVGFANRIPSYAGRVMERELSVLGSTGDTPRPRVYLLGGAKVPDALRVAESVLDRNLADTILTAGLVGNLFLFAAGFDIGDPSADVIKENGYWAEGLEHAESLLAAHQDMIKLPSDIALSIDGERTEFDCDSVQPGGPAFDIGRTTIDEYSRILEESQTAILNGPTGLVEREGFSAGTRDVYTAATHAGYSIVGGGDTAAALRRFEITGFDHVSTGGGAALRMLAGDPLPAVEVLRSAD